MIEHDPLAGGTPVQPYAEPVPEPEQQLAEALADDAARPLAQTAGRIE